MIAIMRTADLIIRALSSTAKPHQTEVYRVFTQEFMPVLALLLLLATIWWAKQVVPNKRPADAYSLRKRANGVDVSEFDVVCKNLKVDNKRILAKELAVVKSFLVEDLKALKRIHFETRSYRDGEI